MSDMFKQINKLTRLFQHHDGLGGNAHAIVNNVNAGFMSSDMYGKFKSVVETRKTVSGTDTVDLHINDLTSGYYNVYKALDHPIDPNTPTTWTSTVDVHVSGDGSKDMLMFDIGNNRMWYQTIGTDGASKGWNRVAGTKLLFNGSAKMGDTVTLTDDITKYANVTVTMTTNDKLIASASRSFAVGTSVVISASQYINSKLYHFQIMCTAITATTMKVIDTVEVMADGTKVATDHCYLHKVIGEVF